MLSKLQAVAKLKLVFPGSRVVGPVDYQNKYLAQVYRPDPDEGDSDVYFTVDPETGAVRDYSVTTDGNLTEIAKLFSGLT